jgi:Restriction endonuclease
VSTWYEKLVQQTYQALLNQESDIKNITVQHNVKLTGKSGASHQIDVYWEFKIADTLYRTCIECRNYTSSIKKSQVAAFNDILGDIGNANGIMVTRVGFQEGALTYANHYGIRLLLINPVLQQIQMNMHIVVPRIENVDFSFDPNHARSVLEAANVQSASASLSGLARDIYLHDKDGNQMRSLAEILSQPIGKIGRISVNFSDEYLKTEYGLIKLNSISFDRQEEIAEEQIIVGGGENIAQTAIEDVLENTSKYLFDDGFVGSKSRRDKPS